MATTTVVEDNAPESNPVVVPVVVALESTSSPETATTALLELNDKIHRLETELEQTRQGLNNRVDSIQASTVVVEELEPEPEALAAIEVIPDVIPEMNPEPMKTKSLLVRLLLGK